MGNQVKQLLLPFVINNIQLIEPFNNNTMTLKEFKSEFRIVYYSDKWSEVMNALFDICAELDFRGVEPPIEWQYQRPACMGDLREKDSYWYEWFEVMPNENLITIGNYLHRLEKIFNN